MNNFNNLSVEELNSEEYKKSLEYQKYMEQHKGLSDKKVCQFKREMITRTLTIWFFGDTVINPSSKYPREIIDKYYGHIVRLTDEMLRIQMEEPSFVLIGSPQIVKEKNMIFNKYFKKALESLNYDYNQIKADIKSMFNTAKGITPTETNAMRENNLTPKSK